MDSLFVDGLGKRYILGGADDDGDSVVPRSLWPLLDRLRGKPDAESAAKSREFWALKDVSFRVEPGTTLGIIGANGAGKSTLLKILARVTLPTTGRVVGVGRLVSLLELGAGFDPDLSDRENIFMNAAMNGIPRADALKRLDAIIQFAEIDQFIDTALKYFSSGMYLRLAFSVAINMDPRILLADEILAVGDMAFQERCLQRVQEEAARGLTVLFVSHDMEAVARICNRVLWIDAGQIVKEGAPDEVISEYQTNVWARADAAKSERGRHSNSVAEIIAVKLVSASGRDIGSPSVQEPFDIQIRFRTFRTRVRAKCAIDLYAKRTLLFRAAESEWSDVRQEGAYEASVRIPANFLAESNYTVTASITVSREDNKEYTLVSYNALSFLTYGSMQNVKRSKAEVAGLIAPRLDWKYLKLTDVVHA